ncbi:MAG TPA: TonB-dependent receptor, partial [Cytophagaceae bacterium]
GVSYTHFFNTSTYSKLSFALSGTKMRADQDSIPKENKAYRFDLPAVPFYRNSFSQVKYSLNYLINKKFSARNTVTGGVIIDRYDFHLADSVLITLRPPRVASNTSFFIPLRNFNGDLFLLQTYAQWQHKFTDKLTLNTGLHVQYLTLNNTHAIEPRVGMKYRFKENQSINVGYGLHSQLQAFQAYFREDTIRRGQSIRTNQNLGFVKSHQFVLGYDNSLGNNLRLKAELYYQYIFNAAIERRPSSFSMLNSGADFEIVTRDSMVNEGKGRNYGLELTFEKFYSNNYYFLFTTSLYDSKYLPSDGIWRNTAFNGKYTFNILGGKEFKVGQKNAFVVDLKVTYAGGRRYIPIDLERSRAQQREYRVESEAYSKQLADYFRTDLKLSYRINGKRVAQEFVINTQNIFNRKNAFIERYNVDKERVLVIPQMGIFPVAQYRITF